MLSKQQQRQLSQAISHALRHEPWVYELELDRNGFVELANVLEALNSVGDNSLPKITAEDVELIIQASEKQRHEIVDGKIRALYGHSLPGLIAREPFVPDSQMELYHATSPELVGNILEQGLAGAQVFNLGTGHGISVLEMVNAFKDCNHVDVPYRISDRRPGDVAACYADVSRAQTELGWKAELGLADMVKDSWRWQSRNPEGYRAGEKQ